MLHSRGGRERERGGTVGNNIKEVVESPIVWNPRETVQFSAKTARPVLYGESESDESDTEKQLSELTLCAGYKAFVSLVT